MQRIGGRAGLRGITFESDLGRVVAADNGRDKVKVFSERTRRLKAALRKVPFLRTFVSFGKTGTAIFAALIALLAAEAFAPDIFRFEQLIPDNALYISLSALVAALLLAAVLLRRQLVRLLQHHGAEHMAINTYRRGFALTVENIAASDRATPSCGSMFVLVFAVVGIPLLFVPYSDFFLPLALMIAFELFVLARRVKWLRWLLRFGMGAQRKVFTRPPNDAQIKAARRGLLALIQLGTRTD